MMSFWDEMARRGEADENMCHATIEECLTRLAPILTLNGNILELGCGTGRLTKLMAKVIFPDYVYGIDSSMELLAIAHAEWQHDDTEFPNAVLLHNDGHVIPEIQELAGVFSVGMFQHVDDDTMMSYISQISDLLEPGGVFVYQFVYEGESGPLSFIRDYDLVRQWGIIPIASLHWDSKNKWCWVTAVKR